LPLSDSPRIPRDDDGPVFREPWEAQAFAMAVKLHEAGVFTWSEWAETLGAEIRGRPDAAYYESWLAALERLTQAKGLLSETERLGRIADWDRAARATPHGQPIALSRSSPATGTVR
jgi:nitrile hydratase accessory protein